MDDTTSTERTDLDFGNLLEDEPLDDFKPREKQKKPAAEQTNKKEPVGNYPSREAKAPPPKKESWIQLNLRVQTALNRRFKDKAEARGARYYALLAQSLDALDALEPSEHRLKRMAEARGIAPEDLIRKALDAYESQE